MERPEDDNRDEHRQEVTTVEIYMVERPSALPAVCAQVPAAGPLGSAASAHAPAVGVAAVRSIPGVSTSQIQAQRWTQLKGRGVRVYGSNGFTVEGNAMVGKAVDVVGGVPPRGRPV